MMCRQCYRSPKYVVWLLRTERLLIPIRYDDLLPKINSRFYLITIRGVDCTAKLNKTYQVHLFRIPPPLSMCERLYIPL